jgi:Zn-dependent oligopeptidase
MRRDMYILAEASVLKDLSHHYKTGEKITDDLAERLIQTRRCFTIEMLVFRAPHVTVIFSLWDKFPLLALARLVR